MPRPADSPFNRVLGPLTRYFTPEAAQRLAGYQLEEAVRQRIDELAERSSAGTLTEAEYEEYRQYVEAIDVLGILQAKARQALRPTGS